MFADLFANFITGKWSKHDSKNFSEIRILMYVVKQGGKNCAIRRAGLIDSEDPKHALFCRDLRAFSGVIFPSFDGSSNIINVLLSLLNHWSIKKKILLIKQVCYVILATI